MEIPVRLPGFELQRVIVRTVGLLSGPKLLINGKRIEKSNGFMRPRDDNGAEVPMRFRHRFFDPIPNLEIGGKLMQLAAPLKWYQYAWMMLPILLVIGGGVLGAICGVIAMLLSARIFRSPRPMPMQYLLTAVVSLLSVLVYVASATGLHAAFSH
jgi:hypothetical protein